MDAARLCGLHAEGQRFFDARRACERFAQRCAVVAAAEARAEGAGAAAHGGGGGPALVQDATSFNPMVAAVGASVVTDAAPDLEAALRDGRSDAPSASALRVDTAWALAAGATRAVVVALEKSDDDNPLGGPPALEVAGHPVKALNGRYTRGLSLIHI